MLAIPRRTGRAIYLTPQAATARLDVLQNAAKAAFDRVTRSRTLAAQYKSALDKINDLVKRSRQANGKRNRIIHDSWGYNDDDKEVSRLMLDGNPDRESVSVPINELRDQLAALQRLVEDAGKLARAFRKQPPLMVDLRNSATSGARQPGGKEIDDLLNGFVGAMVGGFELAGRLVMGVGAVVKAAVGERAVCIGDDTARPSSSRWRSGERGARFDFSCVS
jgi:hypothetical protein